MNVRIKTSIPLMIILMIGLTGCSLFVSIGLLPSEDPIAHWKFERNGSTAHDSSVYGNHGTIRGAQRVEGHFGQGLEFDGQNDRVEVPNSPSLQQTHRVSIDTWAYPLSFPSGGRPQATGLVAYGTGSPGMWELRVLDQGRIYFLLNWKRGSNPDQSEVVTDEVLRLNQWQRVTATMDGSIARVYLDGELLREKSVPPLNYRGDNSWLALGDNFPGVHEYFHGRLDEVKIYNRALDPGKI